MVFTTLLPKVLKTLDLLCLISDENRFVDKELLYIFIVRNTTSLASNSELYCRQSRLVAEDHSACLGNVTGVDNSVPELMRYKIV